jgi:hypothetical protein
MHTYIGYFTVLYWTLKSMNKEEMRNSIVQKDEQKK